MARLDVGADGGGALEVHVTLHVGRHRQVTEHCAAIEVCRSQLTAQLPPARDFYSFTFQLNVGAFNWIGVQGVFSGMKWLLGLFRVFRSRNGLG